MIAAKRKLFFLSGRSTGIAAGISGIPTCASVMTAAAFYGCTAADGCSTARCTVPGRPAT